MNRILQVIALTSGIAIGESAGAGSAGPCLADLDGSGAVGGLDLAILLGSWGSSGECPPTDPADFDGDCDVDGFDLASLLAAWDASGCGAVVIETELAGNSLSQYPFFNYVRGFNQGSSIQIAIDPSFFAGVAGGTSCDVYVVNKKTAAQWSSDPSLVDVTGGFQTENFNGDTIQANTFTVSGTNILNGTTGTQVGIGYDMICDCNRNGVLDGGDFIDGLSDEAGLYVVRDTAAPGPHSVVELSYDIPNWDLAPPKGWGGPSGLQNQNIFYPAGIASLGQAPVILLGHGNGHNHNWYDHLGNHMASYGYVFVSYNNHTWPGVESAATTTLLHTDAFIANIPLISGGALNGHVDINRIAWMGHSRGGEGIAIAYDRLHDGVYTPRNFAIDDIKLLSSIAPTDFQGTDIANPHHANFHLWVGGADFDVHGCALNDVAQSFHLHERAVGARQSVSLHGVGHGDFHNNPPGTCVSAAQSVAEGPCLVCRPRTHAIMRGYLLPLVKRYLKHDIPSKDFLTRQWESFKPIGAPAALACNPPTGTGEDVVVDLMHRDDPAFGVFMIDDYLANPSTEISSSGGAISFNVSNLAEGRLDDLTKFFTWIDGEHMNGMTLARLTDLSFGVVFDYASPSFYEQQIVPAAPDFTQYRYLSFRACQGTRHPYTAAALADLTFDIVLRDAGGTTARINIGAYGGGIEEPYQRGGPETTAGGACGDPPPGWANEFETIRIRLTDFLNNDSDLDLANIVAVRFEFGSAGSSPAGRVGLNEIQLTTD